MTHESTTAWQELLTPLGELDRSFLQGDRAVTDDRHVADGYRMLATTLGVALDSYLFPEPDRPQLVAAASSRSAVTPISTSTPTATSPSTPPPPPTRPF